MHRGYFSGASPALCFILVAGCASDKTNQATVSQPGLPPIHVKVATLPGAPVRPISPLSPSLRADSQGFLSIQIPVTNPSSSPKNFRYSWEWIGPDYVASSTPNQGTWRSAFLEGKDSQIIQSTSTVSNPAAVILRISHASP
jgi:hypothetical protein